MRMPAQNQRRRGVEMRVGYPDAPSSAAGVTPAVCIWSSQRHGHSTEAERVCVLRTANRPSSKLDAAALAWAFPRGVGLTSLMRTRRRSIPTSACVHQRYYLPRHRHDAENWTQQDLAVGSVTACRAVEGRSIGLQFPSAEDGRRTGYRLS